MLTDTLSPISFPGLKIKEFNIPNYFEIGNFPVYYYGVFIATGLLLAVLYGCIRSKQFGIRQDDILDGVLWITPFAIICARLYYCFFKWDMYKADPLTIITDFRSGGLAIYGGVIGAAVGVIAFCAIKKIKLPALLDLVAIGFLIGQSLGRWGNFFNREAYGAETDTFLRMGLMQDADGYATSQWHFYHPTFLYESLWNLAGFLLLHFLSKKRKYDGQIALGYVAWYGLGRAIIEGLRTDSLYIPGSSVLRVSQLVAAVTCFAAVVVMVIMSFKRHDPAKLYVNQVAALTQEDEEAEAQTGEAEEEAEEETHEETEEAPAQEDTVEVSEAAEKTPEET